MSARLHAANYNWQKPTCAKNAGFTFSNGVWSVHLAASDRDGVLWQSVRQRSVVALSLHRNKISIIHCGLFGSAYKSD